MPTAAAARRGRPRVPRRSARTRRVELPEAALGRAAAFVITASRRRRAAPADAARRARDDMEPLSRDRFLAGALLPAAWYVKAQRVRAWYRERVRAAVRATPTC